MGRAYEVRKRSIVKTGAAKAKLYSMYAKEIYSAVKKGGSDPNNNHNLKRLIDKAKKEQVPADIINRAIEKVNSGIDENYISLRYEGFGPSSTTIIIDCLTDNVNRTAGYIRGAFSKVGAKLGIPGSVTHTYDHVCIVGFKGIDEEAVLEILINNDIDIIEIEVDKSNIILYGHPKDIDNIKNSLLAFKPNIIFDIDEIIMLPQQTIKITGEPLNNFNKLLQILEDIEDVNEIYHNVDLD